MTKYQFVQICFHYLHIPYKWGGDDPIQGFDCSGLVQELLAIIGLDPKGDQTAQALYNYFHNKSFDGPRDVGTLIFYGRSKNSITHVGLMISEHIMIEAAGGGSRTNDLKDAVDHNAYVRIRPYHHRKDIVAIINPKGLPWS